jgi:hypothetical protein
MMRSRKSRTRQTAELGAGVVGSPLADGLTDGAEVGAMPEEQVTMPEPPAGAPAEAGVEH